MAIVKQSGLLAITAAVAAVALLIIPKPAQALDTGAAVGIGLGSFALGTALGAGANPAYNPYYAPGYYYPPPAPAYPGYYPAPTYPAARSCWNAYYQRYYAC